MSETVNMADRNYSNWSRPPWLVMTALRIAFENRNVCL